MKIAINLFIISTVLALAASLPGCGVEMDRLYALPLERAPSEGDWARAVPLALEARGGTTSIKGEGAVDDDSVHKTTASCHHGSGAPPVEVEARAFYTPQGLYLRFDWRDPTSDLGTGWVYNVTGWSAAPYRRDGLGIIWGKGDNQGFTCVKSCHLRDWRMAGDSAMADFEMAAPAGEQLDMWVWRAGREQVQDTYLEPGGKGKEPFEVPNSLRWKKGEEDVYTKGDQPVVHPKSSLRATAPRFLPAPDAPATTITGQSRHGDGGWTLTLFRPLKATAAGEVDFAPGGQYRFGLALIDANALDHNAVARPIRLRLVEPAETDTEEK